MSRMIPIRVVDDPLPFVPICAVTKGPREVLENFLRDDVSVLQIKGQARSYLIGNGWF